MCAEPSVVRAMLLDRAHVRERASVHRVLAMLPGMRGVLFLDGEPWLARSRALLPGFQQRVARTLAEAIDEGAAQMLSELDESQDARVVVERFGFDVLLRLAMGGRNTAALGAALVHWRAVLEDPRSRFDRSDGGWTRLMLAPLLVARLALAKRRVRGALDELTVEQATRTRPAWIDRMRTAGFGSDEVSDEVSHLFWAFDAVNYVITAALAELAASERWQRELEREARDVLMQRPFASEDERSMPLTAAFVKEVLRCYPATMGVARKCGAALNAGPHRVDAGRDVILLLDVLHHDRQWWGADAARFDPSRWIERREASDPWAYVPFLEGPRRCVGRHLAEQMLFAVLTRASRDVRLEDASAMPGRTRNMIPRFDGVVRLRAARRSLAE